MKVDKSSLKKIAIVYSDLDGLPLPALEYLLLHLNTLQNDFEFQFLPSADDELFDLLQPNATIPLNLFCEKAEMFIDNLIAYSKAMSEGYGIKYEPIDRVIIISLAKLENRWYEISNVRYSAIFLGDWEKTMAPPSLMEFIVSLVIMEGLSSLLPIEVGDFAHLGTKGCVGDFNSRLIDVRYKTLNGFICASCRSIFEKHQGKEKTDVWVSLLKKEWLGTNSDSQSPASIVNKLGYNLFLTKGLAPSNWEKIKKILSEDGVKEFIKLLGVIIGAAILFWLGFKK